MEAWHYFYLQVPQFILEDANTRSTPCRLVCTQPRRISALSVSERVATERGERLGQTVGYQIRLDNRYYHIQLCQPFPVILSSLTCYSSIIRFILCKPFLEINKHKVSWRVCNQSINQSIFIYTRNRIIFNVQPNVSYPALFNHMPTVSLASACFRVEYLQRHC